MNQPRIEPRSRGSLANTLLIRPMKGVHTFPKGIVRKVNAIVRLRLELSYFEVAAQHFNHFTPKTLFQTIGMIDKEWWYLSSQIPRRNRANIKFKILIHDKLNPLLIASCSTCPDLLRLCRTLKEILYRKISFRCTSTNKKIRWN